MTYSKFCPECDENIEIPDFAIQVICPECQNEWYIDADGEFVDGMWRDRTTLVSVGRMVPYLKVAV
jgi:hypothetical protein